MKPWLFFDIGNVILIDEPLMALNWTEIYRVAVAAGHEITFPDLMTLREEAVHTGQHKNPHGAVGTELFGEAAYADLNQRVKQTYQADFLQYCYVHRDARDLLASLAPDYRLAIAANQPKTTFRLAMEDAGLLDYFEVFGISEEIGLAKPAPEFFEYLLRETGAAPAETIMIGDLISHDIAPAQALGLRTIWVNMTPAAQGYRPDGELELLYVESLRRAPSRGIGPGNDDIRPDATVPQLQALPDAIRNITA